MLRLLKSRIKLFLLLVLPVAVQAAELKPFTTDGCSAFPDGTVEHKSLWADCCVKHDLAYWKGGTYEERLAADQQLKQCVSQVGEPEIARLMLTGVRVGGSPYYPMPYRWGYGWPYMRGYKALTDYEKIQVKERLEQFSVLLNSIMEELGVKN